MIWDFAADEETLAFLKLSVRELLVENAVARMV